MQADIGGDDVGATGEVTRVVEPPATFREMYGLGEAGAPTCDIDGVIAGKMRVGFKDDGVMADGDATCSSAFDVVRLLEAMRASSVCSH